MSRSTSSTLETAAAILAIIQSKRQSPRIEEIEAVLAQAVPTQPFADNHRARLTRIKGWIKKSEATDAKARDETHSDADFDEAERITGELGLTAKRSTAPRPGP